MRGSPFTLVLGVVQPVVFLLVSAAGQPERTPASSTRLAVGVGLTAVWGATVWAAGGILRRDMAQGTLPANVTGVRPPELVYVGKCLAATLRSTLLIVATVAVATVVLGLPARLARPGWLLLVLLLVIASGTALGLLLSCLFLVSRHGAAWSSALMYPVFVLGGMLIPVELLPSGLRWIPSLISLHWAAEALVSAATSTAVRVPAVLLLAALTAGYLVTAVWAFRAVVDRARRHGTLDLV